MAAALGGEPPAPAAFRRRSDFGTRELIWLLRSLRSASRPPHWRRCRLRCFSPQRRWWGGRRGPKSLMLIPLLFIISSIAVMWQPRGAQSL